MRRRECIGLLGAAALAWPAAARAQPFKSPVRVAMFPLGSPTNAYDLSLVEAFKRGLRQTGLIENRDIALDVIWIAGDPETGDAD